MEYVVLEEEEEIKLFHIRLIRRHIHEAIWNSCVSH
jgi:hypothetical protein